MTRRVKEPRPFFTKIREGMRFRRAMYVAKHRGSACTDEIIPYAVDGRRLRLNR